MSSRDGEMYCGLNANTVNTYLFVYEINIQVNYNQGMTSIHDIRNLAKQHKISMKQVCIMAQVQQPQVSRWLSGAVEPLWTSVNQLEQALLKLIDAKA